MNAFQTAYLTCALWSSVDDDGQPLDDDRDLSDCAPDLLAHAVKAEAQFRAKCAAAGLDVSGFDDEQMGHDLWLSRNGHGAGFFDGPEHYNDQKTCDALQDLIRHREVNLYVTKQGQVSVDMDSDL